MLSRLALAVIWLLHFLPLPLLRLLGATFGLLLYAFGRERRRVADTNLGLCFPELGRRERQQLTRRHFVAFGQAFLDRALLWHASPARLRRLIQLKGELPAGDRPVILLAPHFVGLDAGWSRLTLDAPLLSIYSNQKNPVFNAALYAGRTRFNQPTLLSRQEGMRRVIKAMRDISLFYYLPDMDFGGRDAMFIPFFGVPAATITALPRLVGLADAVVVPCLTRLTAAGYQVELLPAWTDYPSGDLAADTRRINAFIEEQVAQMPEQYFWVHKRFKTRPPGERKFY